MHFHATCCPFPRWGGAGAKLIKEGALQYNPGEGRKSNGSDWSHASKKYDEKKGREAEKRVCGREKWFYTFLPRVTSGPAAVEGRFI